MDYSKLSDAELEKLASGDHSQAHDYASMSDEELERLAHPASKTESALRGLAQGASLGFADELTGAGEHLLTGKPYEQARDESRANYHKAEDDNPLTYTAGQVGGGVATSMIPGAMGAKGLITAGAAAGLGNSEANNATDMALDTGKGAAIGLAAAAIPAIGRMGKGVVDEMATTPLQGPAQGVIGKTMQGVQAAGEKGNALLDKVTGGPLGKAIRYGAAGKFQAPLDAAQYGPKAAQYLAGKASKGIDGFMKASPYLSRMSPGATAALTSKLTKRAPQGGPGSAPIEIEQAQDDFVKGN